MFNSYICIITGEKMNLDEKIEEINRYIKYVESVLKQKQKERFWLVAEKKQQEDEKELV
jgi:hypothetical protein